jgi:hypothetical protein
MIGIGLAKGEYEYPPTDGSERNSKCMSQQLFLGASFALVEPERMQRLLDIGASISVPDRPWNNPNELARVLDPVRVPVREWCSSVGLNQDWCYASALVAVVAVAMKDNRAFLQGLTPLIEKTSQVRARSQRVLVSNFGDWDVTMMTRQEFTKRATAQFAEEVSKYTKEIENEAQAAGLVKTPERRNIDTYFWLAGYQVLRWPVDHIAKAENRERPTVGKQIRILASEIALQLRGENDYDPAQTADIIRDALRRVRTDFQSLGQSFIEEIPEANRNIMPPAFYQLISRPAAED